MIAELDMTEAAMVRDLFERVAAGSRATATSPGRTPGGSICYAA
jgi:hypothetical protein